MTNDYTFGSTGGTPHRELPFTTPWVRLVARLRAVKLDSKLALGNDPADSDLLSVRAQQLASPDLRHTVAKSWLELTVQARVPFSPFSPAVPIEKRRVLSAESEIRELANALEGPLPRVRGVAMALLLLQDGAGPIFNPDNHVNLSAVLRDTIAYMDPLAPANS
jgi:hypothetical protein